MEQLTLWTKAEKVKSDISRGYYCANECGDFTHNPNYICDDCRSRNKARTLRYQ